MTETQPRWTEYVPVDDLIPDERNPKRHDDAGLDESLERFGYTEQVMVDERTGRLVAGHGRRELVIRSRDRGDPPPDGVVVDDEGRWMVPVARGWTSRDDEEALAYLIASNRWVERGGWVDQMLADSLRMLEGTDRSLDGVGYTAQQVEDMLAGLAPPATLEEMAVQFGEPGEKDFWPVLRFRVSPEQRERFMALVGQFPEEQQFSTLLDMAERR